MLSPLEKLGVNAQTVQHGVQGMMYLLTECSKLMVQQHYKCLITRILCIEQFIPVWFNYISGE